MNLIKLEQEISDLNQCLIYYENLKNSEFKSENISIIHKLISRAKEKLILNDIQKIGKKDKELMKKHYEDYLVNDWDFSHSTVLNLKSLL